MREQGEVCAVSKPQEASGVFGKGGVCFMRGNEFLDKMELVDPAFVEAASDDFE